MFFTCKENANLLNLYLWSKQRREKYIALNSIAILWQNGTRRSNTLIRNMGLNQSEGGNTITTLSSGILRGTKRLRAVRRIRLIFAGLSSPVYGEWSDRIYLKLVLMVCVFVWQVTKLLSHPETVINTLRNQTKHAIRTRLLCSLHVAITSSRAWLRIDKRTTTKSAVSCKDLTSGDTKSSATFTQL